MNCEMREIQFSGLHCKDGLIPRLVLGAAGNVAFEVKDRHPVPLDHHFHHVSAFRGNERHQLFGYESVRLRLLKVSGLFQGVSESGGTIRSSPARSMRPAGGMRTQTVG